MSKKASPLKRFSPLIIIAAGLTAFFALGGPKYVNLESLKDNRELLAGFVSDHFVLTLLGFIALYAGLVAISFPGAGFLSIFGGFLFGTYTGTIANVFGAATGACLIFLAAKTAFGESLAEKAGPYAKKFETGLKENELSYMFILRLVPLFPFFVINIVPALFDVKFRNYAIATFIGIIPGAFVYTSIGASAGAVFDQGEDLTLKGAMTEPTVLFAVGGLIVLSLIPIVYKKFSKAKPA